MNRIAMSPAAAGVLRGLVARVGDDRDRILLTEIRSVDWQSLTFTGERHVFRFRLVGPDAQALSRRLASGLEDAEIKLARHFVADIAVTAREEDGDDGSISLGIEALTIAE